MHNITPLWNISCKGMDVPRVFLTVSAVEQQQESSGHDRNFHPNGMTCAFQSLRGRCSKGERGRREGGGKRHINWHSVVTREFKMLICMWPLGVLRSNLISMIFLRSLPTENPPTQLFNFFGLSNRNSYRYGYRKRSYINNLCCSDNLLPLLHLRLSNNLPSLV